MSENRRDSLYNIIRSLEAQYPDGIQQNEFPRLIDSAVREGQGGIRSLIEVISLTDLGPIQSLSPQKRSEFLMAVPQDQLRNFLPTQRIPFQDFSMLIEGMSEEQSGELCEHFSVITIDFADENELLELPEQIRNAIHRVGFERADFFDRGPSVLYGLDDDLYDDEEEVIEWEEGEEVQEVEEDERSEALLNLVKGKILDLSGEHPHHSDLKMQLDEDIERFLTDPTWQQLSGIVFPGDSHTGFMIYIGESNTSRLREIWPESLKELVDFSDFPLSAGQWQMLRNGLPNDIQDLRYPQITQGL